jgi:hypothetical protein
MRITERKHAYYGDVIGSPSHGWSGPFTQYGGQKGSPLPTGVTMSRGSRGVIVNGTEKKIHVSTLDNESSFEFSSREESKAEVEDEN